MAAQMSQRRLLVSVLLQITAQMSCTAVHDVLAVEVSGQRHCLCNTIAGAHCGLLVVPLQRPREWHRGCLALGALC